MLVYLCNLGLDKALGRESKLLITMDDEKKNEVLKRAYNTLFLVLRINVTWVLIRHLVIKEEEEEEEMGRALVLAILALVLVFVTPYVEAQSMAPAPAPASDGTSIDQGIAYLLMIVALVLTYLIHPLDASSYHFF
ncbi:Arabinogalactan protein 20 [Tripterygium wilfordii]|uniref:Arabinogalactan protein 20 n=2 Tax=Tripterygium wilfordii TaxID=458696 RepID=A0A7J7CGD8_TRIWF|nr:Arabinogalactan protein 20 [Tripterygium wilfordii]